MRKKNRPIITYAEIYSVNASDYDSLHITVIPLSSRIWNAFARENITTYGDLLRKSREDLMRTRNLGKKSVDLIEKGIASIIDNDEIIEHAKIWTKPEGIKMQPETPDTYAKIYGLQIEKYKNCLIQDLPLKARVKNGLKRKNIVTVADMLALTPTELSRIRNIGALGKKEVEMYIHNI